MARKAKRSAHRMERLENAYTELKAFTRSCKRPQSPVITTASQADVATVRAADVGEATSVAIADLLAQVTEALGEHPRDQVASFLIRCSLACCLASLGVIPVKAFPLAVRDRSLGMFWRALNIVLQPAPEDCKNIECRDALLAYDSQEQPATGLLLEPIAFALNDHAQAALCALAEQNWASADLSIFGSLVEGALDPKRRHKLGAHFTPRAYVLRLVRPTIEEPMRADWDQARQSARKCAGAGEASRIVTEFHARLCATRVLDPACGTGNFLIVALETLYGIEDDVLREFEALGLPRPEARVSPHQMLGIEIDAHACDVTKIVLNICALRRQKALGEASWIST
jgi:hypothetical protein